MAVDTVSWGIITSDLEQLYYQYSNHEKYHLPAKTHSIKQWSEALLSYADGTEFNNEKAYWVNCIEESKNIPVLNPNHLSNLIINAQTSCFSLEASMVDTLLLKTARKLDTSMSDMILACLASALSDCTGHERQYIMLEGHGREDLFSSIDVSRTVGWFTSMYPFTITAQTNNNIENVVKDVMEAKNHVPHNGIGYLIWRYLSKDGQEHPAYSIIEPQICLNYHGRTDLGGSQSLYKLVEGNYGNNISLQSERHFELEFDASIVNGRLNISLTYNPNTMDKATVEKLMLTFQNKFVQLAAQNDPDKCTIPLTPPDYFEKYLTQYQTPGLIVGIKPDGEDSRIYTYGVSNIKCNTKMESDVSIKLGSITKSFVATAVLQLYESGRIDIDKSIKHYLPEIVQQYAEKNLQIITPRKLMKHTSCIGDYAKNAEFRRNMYDLKREWSVDELIRYGMNETPSLQENEQYWRYSSTGYLLLGMIVEKVTQMNLSDYIRLEICDKLGLSHTLLPDRDHVPKNICHCYTGKDLQDVTDISPSFGGSAGGMISTPHDLLIWLDALVNGTLFKNKRIMLDYKDVTQYYGDIKEVLAGFGVFKANGMFGHEGHGLGFQNALYRCKDFNILVALNRDKINNNAIVSDSYQILSEIADNLSK